MNSLSSYTPVMSHGFDLRPYNVFVGAAARKLLGNCMGLYLFPAIHDETTTTHTHTLKMTHSLAQCVLQQFYTSAFQLSITTILQRKQEHDLRASTFFHDSSLDGGYSCLDLSF